MSTWFQRGFVAASRLAATIDEGPSPGANATNDRDIGSGLSPKGRGRPRVVAGPGEGEVVRATEFHLRYLVGILLMLCLGGSVQAEMPRRVLTVRGLWSDLYQCDTAFATLGGVRSVNVWHWPGGVSGTFPGTAEEFARYDLVILANINGRSLPPDGRALLKRYVESGGAVLMLGGYYAFGAEYHGTELAEIAPVEFLDHRDLVACPTGARIAPVKDSAQPRVFWRHTVTPKPGARVGLTADGQPLLITGTFGKGRVAVFAGSVMGEPATGQLPFWEWNQWPVVLAETMLWLAPTATASAPPVKKTVLAQLQAALTSTNGVDPLFEVARPIVDPDFAPVAKALIESGHPAQVTLGLRLLGLSHAPGAKELLLAAFANGRVDSAGRSRPPSVDDILDDAVGHKSTLGDSDLNPGTVKANVEQIKAVQLAALEGLGWLGDPALIPSLREVIRKCPLRAIPPGEFCESFTDSDEQGETAMVAALRCGDISVAAPVVDLWMRNLYTLATMKISDAGAKTKRAEQAVQINRLTAAQPRLTVGLENLPTAVLPALAQRVAVEKDRWIVPLAFAMFAPPFNNGRVLSAEVTAILRQAKLPAVAALAKTSDRIVPNGN